MSFGFHLDNQFRSNYDFVLKKDVKKQIETNVHASEHGNVSPFPKPTWQLPSRAHFSDKKQ